MPPKPKPSWTKEIGLYLLLALGITALMIGFGLVGSGRIVRAFAVNTVVSFGIGLSLGLLYRTVLPRLGLALEDQQPGLRWLLHVISVSAAITIGAGGPLWVLHFLAPHLVRDFPIITVMKVALPITIAVLSTTSIIDVHRTRAARAERENLRSQLAAINARINPHFLFNSLNTLAALIAEDPTKAEAAVLQLSDLFRHTLEGAKKLWVPLQDELTATRNYLDFECLRYGDRLQVTWEVDDGLDEMRVPPLLLQPLVENAVNHGVAQRKGGHVILRVLSNQETVRFEVEDDGPGVSEHSGTKTAQSDLRARLDLAYQGRAELTMGPRADGGYQVCIGLPKEVDHDVA